MINPLAQRLWGSLEMHGGLIALGDVTFTDMVEGLERGWLIRIDEQHCGASEELRRAMEAR